MMGVYIEGLKRPEPIKDCTHRNFVDVRIFDDGTATIRTDESPFFKVYKVKSVPPHGDLIDRDALSKSLDELCDRVCQYSKAQRKVMCSSCPLGDAFIVVEDDAPAIIEAWEGK